MCLEVSDALHLCIAAPAHLREILFSLLERRLCSPEEHTEELRVRGSTVSATSLKEGGKRGSSSRGTSAVGVDNSRSLCHSSTGCDELKYEDQACSLSSVLGSGPLSSFLKL